MSEPHGPQVSFQIQVGLMKGRVFVDSTDLTLKSIKALACSFINEKFPEHGIARVGERILLFKHDYTASNILQVRFVIGCR
jgi:protein kinase D